MSNLSPAQIAAALFNSASVVDELGFIKAQIAVLEAKEKALKDALIAGGQASYSGTIYDVSVSTSDRDTVDSKKLRADLGDEIMAGYVKTSKVTTVRVVARK